MTAARKTAGCISTTLVISVILVAWFSYKFIIPEYHRVASIEKAGWGKDGSLYLVVHWSVRSVGPVLGHLLGLPFDKPFDVPGNLVYRLDAERRVLVKIPIEEGNRLQERWPEIGWLGGRYAVRRNVLYDHETGESRAWSGGTIVSIAPDESYLLWRDDTRALPNVHWFESGVNVPIPDTVIEWVDMVTHCPPIITADGREIHDTVNAKPVYRLHLTTGETRVGNIAWDLPFRTYFATESGIVAPAQKLWIHPVTFVAHKEEMPYRYGHEVVYKLYGPGSSEVEMGPYGIVVNIMPQRLGCVGAGIPSESARLYVPKRWKNPGDYPATELFPMGPF